MWALRKTSSVYSLPLASRFSCLSRKFCESQKKWEVVIGIEVHAQLKTKHKLLSHTSIDFSDPAPVADVRCSDQKIDDYFRFESAQQSHSNAPPNTIVGFCDAGLPGALPTINWDAVEQICKTGNALGGNVQPMSRFDRKHYSYPDLPNSYQITQQFHPLVYGGEVIISAEDFQTLGPDFDPSLTPVSSTTKKVSERKLKRIQEQQQRENEKRQRLGITTLNNVLFPDPPAEQQPKRIPINRIHLEHDSGKSIHDMDPKNSFIDLNRSGLALMEIVSEPEIHSSLEAALFVRKLQIILSHIQTAHVTMESGAMRCDLNISVRPEGSQTLGVRSEIKNLSSIKHLKAACDAEIRRHVEVLSKGGRIYQETRGFNFETQTTFTQRRKETEVDYRFMPDPDLPVLLLSQEQQNHLANDIPKHPDALRDHYRSVLGIPLDKVMTLVNTPNASNYFNKMLERESRDPVEAANWFVVELFGLHAKDQVPLTKSPVDPTQLGSIVDLITEEKISGKIGKKVLREMFSGDSRHAAEIVEEKGWIVQDNKDDILAACNQLLETMPERIDEYQNGDERVKQRLLKFFMGEIMKLSKGKLHPKATSSAMITLLRDWKK